MSTIKMVAIKCPSCNDTVTQEDAKDGYCTCPSCGTTFMIHDDTQKTYITNTVNSTTNINIGNGDFSPKSIANAYFDAKKDYIKFEQESVKASRNALPYLVLYTALLGIVLFAVIHYYKADSTVISTATNEVPTETSVIDLSKNIQIVFDNNSSYVDGEASIAYNWLDSSLSDIKLHAEPKTNLGKGDIVHISVDDLGNHSKDEFTSLEWDWTFDLMTYEKME